jgi:hypothetical protein
MLRQKRAHLLQYIYDLQHIYDLRHHVRPGAPHDEGVMEHVSRFQSTPR